MESALYRGEVYHQRVVPKKHAFTYDIFLLWLRLDEIEFIDANVKGFSASGFAPLQFNRADYLGDPAEPLEQAVLARCSALAGVNIQGTVFLLGQVRTFGLYFSPVNFYFVRNDDGHFTHMLAEVSNTPWNQRHHYLVDLNSQENTAKQFHVSPFNPMDMVYRWSIRQPNERLQLSLSCHQQTRHFTAALNMKRELLNSNSLRHVVMSIPSMALRTVIGIYWQALKLFLKRVPFYSYPTNKKEQKS
ncbi:DUF1365 domain-containing protein [Alteromonas facilis]|uniref:DUF1365 domain-containing protein n=1 Tax=Alteromonas facilis TaxID=2048004 RepID=UPI000C28E438|nr:DUF1365 domain-containing protein [Alteromonas facilis]